MNISINYDCKAFLGAHTGAFWKKLVILMLLAISLVFEESVVIWSMLDCIVEALIAAFAAVARARAEVIWKKRILENFWEGNGLEGKREVEFFFCCSAWMKS